MTPLARRRVDRGSGSRRVAAASSWVVLGKLAARFFDLLALLVLARLLTPADFGLVAIALTVVNLLQAVTELPLTAAMLGGARPGRATLDTAFTLGLCRGALLALAMGAAAQPMAYAYDDPRLTALIWALALAPIARGLINPRLVYYMRRLDFRREFALDIFGKLVALAICVGLALATGSYWAIAAATIAAPLASTALSYALAPYAPRLGLTAWSRFADMVGWNTLAQFVSALNWQFDRFVLAAHVPAGELGRYAVASDLAGIPQQALMAPLSRPLIAAFGARSDAADLGAAYLKASNAMLCAAGPILVAIAVLAEPIVVLALGRDWLAAAPLLAAFAAIVLVSLPAAPMQALAMALDQTRRVALRMAAEFALKAPALLVGVAAYGAAGAVAARALSVVGMAIFAMDAVRRMTGLSLRRQIAGLSRTLAALAAMTGAMLALRPAAAAQAGPLRLVVETAIAGMAGLLVFAAALAALWALAGRPPGVEALVAQRVNELAARRRGRPAPEGGAARGDDETEDR